MFLRMLNLGLRSLTLGSKSLLIFFLAHFLDPSDLGRYGLLVATIGYSLYFLGLDFYTFTTRELFKHEPAYWGALIKNQGALTVLLYCVFIPLMLLIFVTGNLPWAIAGWFFALVVLEHLSQELMRLLVVIAQPITASMVYFLRQGLWSLAILPLMYFDASFRNLETLLLGWTLGGIAAVLLGVVRLIRSQMGGWRTRVDWSRIRCGVKVALPLLISTLAMRGLFTFDRYWLEDIAGLEVLGAYVLFISISSVVVIFLDAGIFAFLYPDLIKAFQQSDAKGFQVTMRKLGWQTLGCTLGYALCAFLLINPLLDWLDKPLYKEYEGMFPWIMLGLVIYAFSMLPHFALYAQGKDRPIIHSHIFAILMFFPMVWLLSFQWPYLAVPLGLAASLLLILFWKTIAYVRLTPIAYR